MPEFVHYFEAGSEPALLLLHPTGGDENSLVALARQLKPGAALLSPRGQSLEEGVPRFFRRLAEGVFDEADLVRRTHELADFIGEASERYGLAPGQLLALGYSNGANIAASLLLLRPEVLRGGMLWRAMTPLLPAQKPNLSGKRVLIASGAHDRLVAIADARRLAGLLEEAGAEVSWETRPAGHELSGEDFASAAEWFAEF